MKTTLIPDYRSPQAEVIRIDQSGILCGSTELGRATTDNFTFGEDISSNF